MATCAPFGCVRITIEPMPAGPSPLRPKSLLNLPSVFMSSVLPSALSVGEYWKFCAGPRSATVVSSRYPCLRRKIVCDPFSTANCTGVTRPVGLPSMMTSAPGGVLFTAISALIGDKCSTRDDLPPETTSTDRTSDE